RQLVALTTFSDLVGEVMQQIHRDALAAALLDDSMRLRDGGTGASGYAEATGVYLAFSLSKLADYATTICRWFPERDSARSTFARQALPMSWDYTELNPIHDATGSIRNGCTWVAECLNGLAASFPRAVGANSEAVQADARTQALARDRAVSTDPPYYDNIGYA